jgi:hypothetical protein
MNSSTTSHFNISTTIGAREMKEELQKRIARIESICGGWGLYEDCNSTANKQALKATSEIGELADAILKNDIAEIQDAIGDIFICWVNYLNLGGCSSEDIDDYNLISYYFDRDTAVKMVLRLQGNKTNTWELGEIAQAYDLSLLDCIDSATEVISKRTGKIINGAFFKNA